MLKWKKQPLIMFVLVAALLINLIQLPNQATAASGEDEYNALRLKIFNVITGGDGFDPSDPDIAPKIAAIESNARLFWSTMNKAADRTYLWSELSSPLGPDMVSNHVSGSYSRLQQMAIAYSTKGTSLFNDAELLADIISGMDWMYTNRYNLSVPVRGYDNWYDWQISSPISINNVSVLLYSHLSARQISDWHAALERQALPFTASNTGANRVWTCNILITSGIITKNSSKITTGVNGLSSVLDYVVSGEGFYRDGSFLQHTALIPYNGGYGISLIDNLTQVMYIVTGSSWDIADPDLSNVYQWIYDAYEPLFYNGSMMAMVTGRNIARIANDNLGLTSIGALGSAVVRLAYSAPNPADAVRYKSLVKQWMSESTSPTPYASLGSIQLIAQTKALMNDPGLPARGDLVLNKQYPNMARAVHRRPDFAFGISMSSKKVANYESINNENLKGWHTGDGMTYLYNADLTQYQDAYWPTVDSHRLPGTTVIQNSEPGGQQKNGSSWAGGTEVNGLYGVTGMQVQAADSSLSAYKSWFMFDDEIVNLGAGIQSADNSSNVETIVDNRKLNETGDNKFIVDGEELSSALGWEETLTGISWAHLTGNTTGADIGYYFPIKADIQILRESRTATWNSINNYFNDINKDPAYFEEYTRRYLTLWVDHGTAPSNAAYSYVQLPNKTAMEVARYASAADITVLENSREAQAVKENRLGITGINFWQDAVKTVNGITSNKKASVMVQSNNEGTEISVSDPTMENSGTITIDLDMDLGALAYADPGITVNAAGGKTRLTVNVTGALGKSLKARFNKPGMPSAGPDAPSGLTASESTEHSIKLNWNAVEGAADYRLYRAEAPDGEFLSIRDLQPGATSFTDTNLKSGSNYFYKVAALNQSGMSGSSQPLSTWTVPVPPAGLSVTGHFNTGIPLSWQPAPGAEGYVLYRSDSKDGPFQQLNSTLISSLTYTDTAILSGINYYYRIAAVNDGGVSRPSIAIPSLFAVPTYLINEDFNGMSAGNLNGQNGWVGDNGGVAANTIAIQLKDGSDYDQLVKISTNAKNGKVDAYKLFNAPQGNTLIVETTAVADDSTWKNALIVADSSLASGNIAAHVVMENGKMWGYKGGTKTDILASITNGVPYRIKAVINTSTKKFDVYVNDELRASQWSYRYSGIGKLDKFLVTNAQNLNSSMSFDDVKVSYMPLAPSNVQASALSASNVSLTWSASPGAAEYRVYRSSSPGMGFELISEARFTGLSYTDKNLMGNMNYFYKVVAVHQQAVSPESVTVSSTTLPHPDQSAPVTTAAISGIAGPGGWYRQSVTVALSVYDAESGVAGTQYKLNDGGWTAYTAPVTVSSEGTNTLKFYSTDLAGTAEAEQTISVLLDETAPVLTLTQSGQPVHDVFLLDVVQFALTVSDSLSGTASQWLLIDGKPIGSGDSIPALQFGTGIHTVKAAATDSAGNTAEESWRFSVNIDFATFHAWLAKLLQDGQMKNEGIRTSLEAKLSQAESQLAKDHPDQAVKHLNDLVKTIDTFKDNGNLNAQAADDLKQAIVYFISVGLK